jgi:hypothetical protein
MAVLGVTPFLLPVLQPYGGEMLLRVFLFALPAAAFFIARLAFPSAASGRGWPTAVAIAVISCILLGAFQFARYGNERLDAFTKGDVDTVRELYQLAPPGSKVIGGTGNIPWRFIGYADREYSTLEEFRDGAPRVQTQPSCCASFGAASRPRAVPHSHPERQHRGGPALRQGQCAPTARRAPADVAIRSPALRRSRRRHLLRAVGRLS